MSNKKAYKWTKERIEQLRLLRHKTNQELAILFGVTKKAIEIIKTKNKIHKDWD